MEKMTEKQEVFRLYYIYIAELIKEHLLAIIGIRDSYIKKIATLCSVLSSDILQN